MPPPQFPCTIDDCNRTFTKKGNLTVHIDTVHKNQKKFVCGVTDLTGSSKLIYDDGAEVPWDREREGCGRGFGTKAMLENHIRTKHLGLEAWDKVSKRKRGVDLTPKRSTYTKGGNHKAQYISAASLLTGQGYEDSGRDIACLVPTCPHRFYRDFDLRRHCTSAHGMAEVEVEDGLRERAAAEGGVFWYRGIDPEEERGFALFEEDDEAFDSQYMGRRGSTHVPIDPSLDGIEMSRIQDFVNGVE
jgi:general transcription factor IIIA